MQCCVWPVQVVGVRFLEERSNGKSRGIVYVEFADSEAAALAKEKLQG